MKIGYTSREVCRVIGISYRQLDYWDSSAFIQPSVAKAKGTGTSRMYSFVDLVCLRTAKRLRDSGISLQKIRKSVGYLRTHFPKLDSPLADLVFLTDGSTVFILTRDRNTALDTVMEQGQLAWFIPVGRFVNELRGQIVRMEAQEQEEKEEKHVFEVVVEEDGDRFHAYCPVLKGCHTWGHTREEAIEYIKEAVELYVDDLIKAGDPIPGVGWAEKIRPVITTAA
jgi:predicted RNase H-like HicB family nuclease